MATIYLFSPEAIFVNIATKLIDIYKEKMGKKAEVKVKSKDSKKKR